MPVMAVGGNEEETEKRLGAALLAGQPLISIDNDGPANRRQKSLGRLLWRHVGRDHPRRLLVVDFHLLRGLAPAAVED